MTVFQKLALRYIRAKLHILTLVSPERAAKKAFQLFCTPRRKSHKKPPPLFEKGENLFFRLDDHVIRGHRWLPHEASSARLKKALILHGFESSSRNFDQYVGALLKNGYEVLAFDAPAHGQSGGKRITLPLYSEMIRTVVDQYGPIHAFMGHSLGALALVLFLESMPHDDTTRMALIAPAVEATSAVDMFFQLLELSDEVRTAFDAYEYNLYGLPFSWFSLRRALDKIKAGVLWVQDEDDTVTPLKDTLPIQEERRPNIRFVITRGLGHRKIYRDAKVMQQVVAFLSADQ
jgi:pimeloyl-ACP methyl ester carboxylesterase